MGLDMNLYAEIDVEYKDDIEYKHQKPAFMFVDVGYWRKAWDIHGYIMREFTKGNYEGCDYIYLSRENLEKIREWCIQNTDEYRGSFDRTRDIITDALNMNNASIYDFYYSASW